LLSHHTITNHPTVSQSLSIQALESLKLSLQTILSFSAFSIEILLNYSNDWESLYQENQQSMIKGKGKEKRKGFGISRDPRHSSKDFEFLTRFGGT